jgi:C-C_Bond_Lyase of the TIM-Barrel fold
LIGVRRPVELTAYDIAAVASVVGDVVNIFCRAGRGGVPVSGPVWEYFDDGERLLNPQLRASPPQEHDISPLRTRLVSGALDGLVREAILDRANGLTGKSVIHPSHVAAVHALSVVAHEEYADASDIVSRCGEGGVSGSSYGNKMNESSRHQAWALSVLRRADAFGVARAHVSFVDLLEASVIQ